jgi:RNA polymerase sigma-70 factor (ECF subfamily)
VPPLSERAFVDLHAEAARPLWAYVYRVTGQAADADDIVQEAFCRMLTADVGALAHEDLRRYLFRIASNLIADRWRHATRERDALTGVEYPVHSEPDLALHDVAGTFSQLNPRDRALLWLAYVEEQSHKDMAATLRVAPGSIRVLLSRARHRLRALLRTVTPAGEQRS